jgi:hypothetical protein
VDASPDDAWQATESRRLTEVERSNSRFHSRKIRILAAILITWQSQRCVRLFQLPTNTRLTRWRSRVRVSSCLPFLFNGLEPLPIFSVPVFIHSSIHIYCTVPWAWLKIAPLLAFQFLMPF